MDGLQKDGYIFAPSEDVNNNEYTVVGTGYDYIKKKIKYIGMNIW